MSATREELNERFWRFERPMLEQYVVVSYCFFLLLSCLGEVGLFSSELNRCTQCTWLPAQPRPDRAPVHVHVALCVALALCYISCTSARPKLCLIAKAAIRHISVRHWGISCQKFY